MGSTTSASSAFVVIFFLLSQLIAICSSHSPPYLDKELPKCPHFHCSSLLDPIGFPFASTSSPECGLWTINCSGNEPKAQFQKGGRWYSVKQMDFYDEKFRVYDPDLKNNLKSGQCDFLNDFTEQGSPLTFEVTSPTFYFIKCKRVGNPTLPHLNQGFYNFTGCRDYDLLFGWATSKIKPIVPEIHSSICSVVQLPVIETMDQSRQLGNLLDLLAAEFSLKWHIVPECINCYMEGDQCVNANGKFKCEPSKTDSEMKKGSNTMRIGAGVGAGVGTFLVVCILFFCYHRRRKQRLTTSSTSVSKNISSDPSLKMDLEKGGTYFQTPIFTYDELEEATNNFDSSKELGDGGFGTVYHGKLRDGRVVAVKRLYENNFKRVEQFMNEIAILSRIRHHSLVSLYGCTSRHCRELLLVYEFIPNGTVADHLHGVRTKPGIVTWPIRLNIAIESADALAYLHASDIIHRDVKTNNILLDNDFHVKVADFGLSRLFPTDVTHVSTAPQGTPGYVDPEYYQCYQLTDKSDVYSFGVVLIELISSKPAVDVNRHRHDINLANMAINKIQNHALQELVDPYLEFESSYAVRMMITSVAELAFRCLQQDREMRPSMVEVLEVLRGIQSEEYNMEKAEEVDIPADDVGLLRNMPPHSPDSVTDKWTSSISTTPNTSC